MGKLYAKYGGEDLDVASVYAESLLVLKPWRLWVKDDTTGETIPADNNTLIAKSVLTRVG